MPVPSDPGRAQVASLARQTGFSADAVESMLASVVRGGGRMAQFDHPEFGGSGQWMHGGMLMISDLSNHELKARIGRLCDALAEWVAADPVAGGEATFQTQNFSSGGAQAQDSRGPSAAGRFEHAADRSSWYPASLGRPDSSGAQDTMRYAWFGGPRRLVIDDGSRITVYDTGDHRIGGVSQQQGGDRSVAFTSQHGTVDLGQLAVVGGSEAAMHDRPSSPRPPDAAAVAPDRTGDPFAAIEKLAGLHARGILDDDEFATKKAELLRRI